MRYKTEDCVTRIYVESGEQETDVLTAIAKASFELAVPVGAGILHFQHDYELSDDDTSQILQAAAKMDQCLAMDYVQGRQCKTYLRKNDDGVICLSNNTYERDRGKPDAMLDRAIEILSN